MINPRDRLRIRMLSYVGRLLVLGLNNRNASEGMLATGTREVEIARELLDILNETGDSKNARKRS